MGSDFAIIGLAGSGRGRLRDEWDPAEARSSEGKFASSVDSLVDALARGVESGGGGSGVGDGDVDAFGLFSTSTCAWLDSGSTLTFNETSISRVILRRTCISSRAYFYVPYPASIFQASVRHYSAGTFSLLLEKHIRFSSPWVLLYWRTPCCNAHRLKEIFNMSIKRA